MLAYGGGVNRQKCATTHDHKIITYAAHALVAVVVVRLALFEPGDLI